MTETTRRDKRARTRRRRIIWWSVAGVLVLAVAGVAGVTAYLVPKALSARDHLTASIPLVSEIQSSVLAGDTDAAQAKAAQLVELTSEARSETSGRVWRALEWVPWAGENLKAVRVAADVTSDLAVDAITPISGLSISALTPQDGGISMDAVDSLITTIDGVSVALSGAKSEIDAIDRAPLVAQVSSALTTLSDAIDKADGAITGAQPVLDALPGILGADGPRDILILFQNNGEVMPGGGTIGSLAQVHIDNGKIDIVRQASAAREEFPPAAEPVVELPDDTWSLYGNLIGRYVQSLTRTPRFDVTFDIAQEMWRRKTGVTVDAVIALDVVALTRLLDTTGPVALPNGLELDADNAIDLLLGDLYYDYEPLEVDAINQAFAGVMVTRLLGGKIPVPALLDSLRPSIEEGRVRVWSARDSERKLLSGTDIDRRGPTKTADATQIGVYFMDATPGKMQRFMTQSVAISNLQCAGQRQIRVAVTLTNTVTTETADRLPVNVTGYGRKTPLGSIRVSTLLYVPGSFDLSGNDWGSSVALTRKLHDGEFDVTQVQVLLAPGESRTLDFDYLVPGEVGIIDADITPVVNRTVSKATPACAH